MVNTWFLISLVIAVERCEATSEYTQIPLPSKKVLWEANSQELWEAEYQIAAVDRQGSQLFDFGDLLLLHQAQSAGRDSVRDNDMLDEWNSGVDGLGMLITIATAIL
jgi:hypothetical protein